MSISEYQFNRWRPQAKTSWAWRVFKKHNLEFYRMYIAFDNAHKFTYEKLGQDKAQWSDLPAKHFKFDKQWEYEKFSNLKDWSSAFNQLENWMNLNALVAILSNLETYIATIVPLALESDIGVLFGLPNKIDGIEILKHGKDSPFNFTDTVVSCTKGTWDSRIAAYKRSFGRVPKFLEGHISHLDKMRNLRNNVAHAFGRDIEASRKKGVITTLPIETLSRERLLEYQQIVWKTAKAIDAHLHNFHIGEYQRVLFYHELYPHLNHNTHPNQRAVLFKKKIGQFGDIAAGKEFCKGLVTYYEAL
jgi:hypothetical protein